MYSGGLGPHIFPQKMEKTRSMRDKMDGKVFISRQSRHFLFIAKMIKVLISICTLTWRVNNYVSCQQKHKENKESQSRNTSAPRINEEYITQVSEKIEVRVTKKLSHEFSRTEFRIFGALSNLDEFLSRPQTQMLSGTVPGASRNTDVKN